MQFKIKNTTYKISFSFLALILYILTLNKSRLIGITLLFAILHEIVHLIFILWLSVAPVSVSLNLLGANIKRCTIAPNKLSSEIIINASAPVFNIFTGAFFQYFSMIDTKFHLIFSEIAMVNLGLGLFNIIPYYTFDGGNVLKYILLRLTTQAVTEKILTCVSLVVTVIFSFVSIHIFLNYKHNFTLLITCIYMFLSIIFKKQNSLDY